MGYTMSMDASCKVQRGALRGYLSHAARDVDKSNGIEVRHSNTDIDASRTSNNITYVYDADGGGYRFCQSADELMDALDKRLEHVKKPLRKDAVVLRPVIMQLDPDWYKDTLGEEERARSYQTMANWVVDTFGEDNVIGLCLHLDETNPHLHCLVTPVTDDGRLSQKDWFRGPAALREMHDDLRQHMRDNGFDVDLQRKKPGKHAKRMDEREYKDFAELQKAKAELEQQQQDIQEQQDAIRRRDFAVSRRERAADRRERQLKAREEALAVRSVDVDDLSKTALELHRSASMSEVAVIKWAEGKGWKKSADNIRLQSEKREQKAQKVKDYAAMLRSDPEWKQLEASNSADFSFGL